MVPLPGELQVDAAVLEALAIQPVGQPGGAQQPNRAVLQQAGPLPGLAVGAAAILHHHGVDPGQGEQAGQQQPGRPRPDDADLSAFADHRRLRRGKG